MSMDEILRENTSESKENESNNLGMASFESELLKCVKEVVENISMKEKEGEDSNEKNFLNSMDEENNSPFQIKEKTSSDISALFEMATKNSPTEFEPFNPFCGFTSMRESFEDGTISPSEEPDVNFNVNKSSITAEISRKPRKRIRKRKNWIIKKRIKKSEAAVRHSMFRAANYGNGYARLYESCLNFCHHFNKEVPSVSISSSSSSDGNSLHEKELIAMMAKDLINKIDKDNVELTNEKNSLKEKQVVLLKKLVELLKEKSCSSTNGETVIKNNLPLEVDESRSKFDFCGFESSKPPSRNSEGEITLDKLFGQSPPASPIHVFGKDEDFSDSRFVSLPVSPNSIMDLDFVFKPLFNPFPVSESVSSCSETIGKKGYKNSNSKNLVNVRSRSLIRNYRTQGVNSKIIIKKIKKNSKVALKRLKKPKRIKNSKLNVGNANRKTRVKIARNTLISNTFSNNSNNSDASPSLNPNEDSKKTFQGFSKGSFGAPKRSSLLNLRSSLRSLTEVSKGNQIEKKSDVCAKRKLDQMSRELQTSKNNSTLTPKSKFTVDFFPNLRSKSTVSQPPYRIENSNKPLQAAFNKAELGPAAVYSKISVKGEANTSSPSTKEQKTPEESPKSHVLYYPVHPFVSHDLPVHFIPIDSSRIPQFLPLYSPVINSKNSSPIYPSFIRTLPHPKVKTPNDYVLSKGIKTKSIPIRSFSEEKVKENIFPSMASKCPLIPEIPSVKLTNMNKSAQSSLPNKKESNVSSLTSSETRDKLANIVKNPNNFVNTPSPLHSQIKPNQKIHLCQKCGFTTPKLGVLKRHELSHSQGQIVENKEIFRPELGLSHSQGQIAESKGIIANSFMKNNYIQHDPQKKAGISSSSKQSPTQKKTASTVNNEEKGKIANDQKNSLRVNNEIKVSVINNQNHVLKVNNEKKVSIVNNEKMALIVNNEKKASIVNNEKKPSIVNNEKKPSIVNNQKNASIVNNEKKASIVNTEKKASIVNNQKNASKINNEKNTPVVSGKTSNFAIKLNRNNIKIETLKNKESLSSSDDSNSSFNGFKENSVREKFMKRFPGVTITPLYNPVES